MIVGAASCGRLLPQWLFFFSDTYRSAAAVVIAAAAAIVVAATAAVVAGAGHKAIIAAAAAAEEENENDDPPAATETIVVTHNRLPPEIITEHRAHSMLCQNSKLVTDRRRKSQWSWPALCGMIIINGNFIIFDLWDWNYPRGCGIMVQIIIGRCVISASD